MSIQSPYRDPYLSMLGLHQGSQHVQPIAATHHLPKFAHPHGCSVAITYQLSSDPMVESDIPTFVPSNQNKQLKWSIHQPGWSKRLVFFSWHINLNTFSKQQTVEGGSDFGKIGLFCKFLKYHFAKKNWTFCQCEAPFGVEDESDRLRFWQGRGLVVVGAIIFREREEQHLCDELNSPCQTRRTNTTAAVHFEHCLKQHLDRDKVSFRFSCGKKTPKVVCCLREKKTTWRKSIGNCGTSWCQFELVKLFNFPRFHSISWDIPFSRGQTNWLWRRKTP